MEAREARQVIERTLEVADIAESIREYLSQERCDDGPVVFPCVIRMMPGAAETLLKFIENAQGQREEMARLKRLVKMALLEGVAIGMHREDLTEPWENGERAWNGSKASEEVNMAIGTKK